MPVLKLIAGTSHPTLAREISKILKVPLTPITIKKFADGEIYVRVDKTIRGQDVYVIQSLGNPVNENLLELLIILDSLRRASVGKINLVIPYLCYSRQDRKNISREPITAKLISNMITYAGANRLITYDLHADQIQGFYDIPVDHLLGYPLFIKHLTKSDLKNLVVVSPDVGGVKRANKLADYLGVPIAIIDKIRTRHNESMVAHIVGNVEGKVALIIDDMVDTGGSITNAAKEVMNRGAKKCIICATHPILSKNALERLTNSPASKIIFLNTLPTPKSLDKKFKIVSVAPVLAQVIKLTSSNKPLEDLFVSL